MVLRLGEGGRGDLARLIGDVFRFRNEKKWVLCNFIIFGTLNLTDILETLQFYYQKKITYKIQNNKTK